MVVSILSAYVLFKPLIEQIKDINDSDIRIEYVIVNSLFRMTLLGMVLFAVKESLKNFNINMHLYSLNLHRQNTLQSFDALISGTSKPETRDLIVKEIAQTIYGNQEDGYLSNSSKKTISISQITELVKVLK